MNYLLKFKNILLILALCFFIFLPSLDYGFVDYDDYLHLKKEVTDLNIENIISFWLKPYSGLFIPVSYNIRHILVFVSNLINDENEISPLVFHTYSVINHLLNILLIYIFFLKLEVRRELAIVSCLFFAFHPLQVESITWTSQIGIVSGFSFCIASMYYFHKHLNQNNYTYLLISILLFIFASLCKPNYIIIPIILLVLFYDKILLRYLFLKVSLFFIPSIIIMMLTKYKQLDKFIYYSPDYYERFKIAISNMFFYLHKLFMPVNLVPDYGIKFEDYINDDNYLYKLLVILCMFFYMLKNLKSNFSKGILIFFIGLLPVMGFILFRFQNLSLVADRYTYLRIFGISYSISHLRIEYYSKFYVFIFICISMIMIKTSEQIKIWENTETLLKRIIKINDQSFLAHNNLGLISRNSKDYHKAIKHFSKAIRSKQRPVLGYYNRAITKMKMNDYKGAVTDFSKVLKYNKKHKRALYNRGISKEIIGIDGTKDIKMSAKLNFREAKIWMRHNQ